MDSNNVLVFSARQRAIDLRPLRDRIYAGNVDGLVLDILRAFQMVREALDARTLAKRQAKQQAAFDAMDDIREQLLARLWPDEALFQDYPDTALFGRLLVLEALANTFNAIRKGEIPT